MLSRIRTAGWGALVALALVVIAFLVWAYSPYHGDRDAIADTRPLSTFTAAAPGVSSWAVGGHSLGGVRACLVAADGGIDGLFLLGSYCANDLSAAPLTAVSVEGANDGLSTPAQIDAATELLPASVTRVSIPGANHASFGDYGAQSGDGPLEVDRAEVRAAVAEAALLLP